jgi:hypothetical protein
VYTVTDKVAEVTAELKKGLCSRHDPSLHSSRIAGIHRSLLMK